MRPLWLPTAPAGRSFPTTHFVCLTGLYGLLCCTDVSASTIVQADADACASFKLDPTAIKGLTLVFSSQMTNAADSTSFCNDAVQALGYFSELSNNSL